jgi:hypothetical protein
MSLKVFWAGEFAGLATTTQQSTTPQALKVKLKPEAET